MGNIAYHFLPFYIGYETKGTTGFTHTDILPKQVEYIEERCENLYNYQKPNIGANSFLVLHTTDGDLVRIDYYSHSVEPNVTINYQTNNLSDSFRMCKVNKELTISDSLKIIRSHCVKEQYNSLFHNSQHVARDSFMEISGIKTYMLRNDYLRWYRKSVPYELRKNYGWDNEEYEHARMFFNLVNEHGENSDVVKAIDPANCIEGMKKFFEEMKNFKGIELEQSELTEKEWSEKEKKKMFDEMLRRIRESGN